MSGVATVSGGRLSSAFAYLTAIFAWLLFWWVATYVVEFIVNVLLTAIIESAFAAAGVTVHVPSIDLPTPFTVVTWAIQQFTPLWNIGGTIMWGFVEEVTFILAIFFGLIGEFSALTSVATPFRTIGTFLFQVSNNAALKRRESS